MSQGLLAFLSWTRRGLTAAGADVDPLSGPLPAAAPVQLGVRVNARAQQSLTALVHGAGDVTTLDPLQIIRTDPRPGDDTFPPHLFPTVDLDRHDLPWLLTPARATSRDRLRPWLVLVVVERDKAELVAGGALPALQCRREELPDLDHAHLWAHTQVTLDGPLDDDRLDRLIDHHPDRSLARLVAARRLHPRRRYLACVVPAFEAGRKTALGQPLDDIDRGTLVPAWKPGTGPAPPLPVFHHWEFATGDAGSFEALVDRLQARPLPRTVGVRDLDISRAGGGLLTVAAGHPGAIVELEGALRSPATFAAPWDPTTRQAFASRLRLLLDADEDEVAPPVYGLTHAGRHRFAGDAEQVAWLRQLNLDPRYRAIAALGTRVVQEHQEELVAAAWEQAARLAEVNQALRQAQLGRTVDQAIYDRRIHLTRPGVPLPDDRLLQISSPAHVDAGLAPALGVHRGVRATATASFRKATRPGRSIARHAGDETARPMARLADNDVVVVPPLTTPPGMISPEAVSARESMRTLTSGRVTLPLWAAPPREQDEKPVPAQPHVAFVGAAMPNRTFVITTDGRVLSRVEQDGRSWWLDHGTPPGTTATSAPAAVRDLAVYVAGADRHVHELRWDGDCWVWNRRPLPNGRLLAPGAAPWATWADHRPGEDIGQSGKTFNMVWIVADDGNLYEFQSSSEPEFGGYWDSHGNPGVALDGRPGSRNDWTILVRAVDGRLFERSRGTGTWVWRDLGGQVSPDRPFWHGLRHLALGHNHRLLVRVPIGAFFSIWLPFRTDVASLLGVLAGQGPVVATTNGEILLGRLANPTAPTWERLLPAPPGFTAGTVVPGIVRSDGKVVVGMAGRYLEGSGGQWRDFGTPAMAGAGSPSAAPARNKRWRTPLGFMSNFVVAHLDVAAEGDRIHPRLGSDVGFDAEVRGGWVLRSPMPDAMGTGTQGIGVALADVKRRGGDEPRRDLVTAWISSIGSRNVPSYRIGWDVDGGGSPTSWSSIKRSPTPVVTVTTSSNALTARTSVGDVDVDVADLDGDGRPELVMVYATAESRSKAYYRIAWGLEGNGEATGGWSESQPVPVPGGSVVGVGAAVADMTGTLRPDLVVLFVTQMGSALTASYVIGRGLNARGLVTGGWTEAVPVEGGPLPAAVQGVALTVADFSGSERPDLVVFLIDDGPTDNTGWYRVGWDVAPPTPARAGGLAGQGDHADVAGAGHARRWTSNLPVPGWFGWVNRGAGIAIGDLDPTLFQRKKDFATAFTTASTQHQAVLAAAQRLPPTDDAAPLALPTVAAAARTALQPSSLVDARLAARLDGIDLAGLAATDRLNPLLLAPSFDVPAYELVRDIAREHLLPGVDDVPPETVSLLRANPSFIEAFMVGLNHEMGRELLWREVPTDRRATYFRQFWEPVGDTAPGAPVTDIPPIRSWRAGASLGDNATGVGGPDMAVLVVRGELLRRHPNASVYAIRAAVDADGRRRLTEMTLQPSFRGSLPPDISFFGFPITVAEARGMGNDHGWFFAFAEHPTEPRFGLDEPAEDPAYGTAPTAWNHLDWANVVPDAAAFDALTHVPLDPPFPRTPGVPVRDDQPDADTFRWAENAAHMAHITLQRPVLLAVHATDLLTSTTGEWRVTHVVRRQRRIEAIAGRHPDGRWWQLSIDEVVTALGQREEFFVEQPPGHRAVVTAVRGRNGRTYLRTRADRAGSNNLSSLPNLR